jgi:glycosyl transferase family 87
VLPFVPLTVLPLSSSYLVWAGVQLALLACLIRRLLTRVAVEWRGSERGLLVAASLAAPPLLFTLLQGALSLLVTVAILELYIALRERRDGSAGVWLVVASLKPQVALAPGVALLAGRRWRTLLVGGSIGLVLVLAATAVMGVGIWSSYLRFLADYLGSFDLLSVRPSVMWNLRGTLTLLIGPGDARDVGSLINGVALAGELVAVAATAWLWRRRWDPDEPAFGPRFALTVLLGLLLSPHLNPHDAMTLVPIGAIAYDFARRRPGGEKVGLVLFLAPFVVLITNSLSVNEAGGPPIRTPVLLMIGLAIWLAYALRSATSPDDPTGGDAEITGRAAAAENGAT